MVNEVKENKERKMYASLHTHSKDTFDSQNEPDRLCAKFAEYGAAGFVLTQHGVLSEVEDMRKSAAKYNLKFVPGIETYFNAGDEIRRHLILMAVDDDGYHTLCKAVTDANDEDGMSVMDETILKKYFAPGKEGHGHVIATSACIQGIIAVTLRTNEFVENKIRKIRNRQDRYAMSPEDERYQNTVKKLAELDAEIEKNKEDKIRVKKLADTKFGVRERQIRKLKESGAPEVFSLENELVKDKKRAEEAKKEYEDLVSASKSLTVKRSAVAKEAKEYELRVARWTEDEEKINSLKNEFMTEESMLSKAEQDAVKYLNIFGSGFFFMEIQNHGIDTEAYIYPRLAQIARKIQIPIVATNDIHTVTNNPDELLQRRILRSLRFGNDMEKEHVGDDQLYVKTDAELYDALVSILPADVAEEGIRNIKTVFDRCNVTFHHENHYPVYISDSGKSAEEILRDEAFKGIPWRFPNGFPDERYQKRLEYELDIINSMGYANYHLVVKDYLEYGRELGAVPAERLDEAPFDIEALKEWKKENGWDVGFSIGPGRGSAVGSLVCYLIGITALDPIKYDLLFERFLNPERVSMPDIDSDFSNTIRQKVIQYVQHKYGKDSVCGIMTTNAQAPKGSIRIAAKYYGYETKKDGTYFLSLADAIAKKVPAEPGISFEKSENGITLYERLCKEYAADKDALEILKWAKAVEGAFTAYGAHAAGIVISDGTPIKNNIPLRWNKSLGEWTTQMDMISVEENGYLKMDFLGLKTLDIITDCLKAVKKTHGVSIDPLSIPLDDKAVYEKILCPGNTKSVFQFESAGMRNMLQRFQPNCFEDLIILVAMFRPGPLQYLDGVIAVKHGKKPEYITDKLIPLLQNTYSAIVFQEQVMQIFQDLAGYTLGGADQVRRAMSKKKLKVLEAERTVFIHGDESRHIRGCVANGIPAEKANALFDQMTDFAKYAFNRSHAAVYALIGYYTAWLKLYYPAEFLMAAMNWAMLDDIPGLMQEAKKLCAVCPPDVNRSESRFSVDNGEILFGLSGVKAVGNSSEEIIEERKKGPYRSFVDFFYRTNVKKDAVENLIKAGAFDGFCKNRASMLEAMPKVRENVKKLKEAAEKRDLATEDIKAAQFDLFGESKEAKRLLKKQTDAAKKVEALTQELNSVCLSDEVEDMDIRLKEEREYLGAYVTGHPLDQYPDSEMPLSDISDKTTRIYGMIRDITIKYRKSDRAPMAFFVVEDRSGEVEVCAFTKQYARLKNQIQEGAVVVIEGNAHLEERNDTQTWKFYAENIKPARKRAVPYRMTVPSYYGFVARERAFRDAFEEEGGHPFFIYDAMMDELRKMQYTVSDEALTCENVKAM